MKNAFDWVYPEWNRKAVGFVGYGSTGGARAVEHMRNIAVELQMAPVRQGVHIMWDLMAPLMQAAGAARSGPASRRCSSRPTR